MAYYCLVTDVTRTHKTGCRVDYSVMDDSVTPSKSIDTGSVGIEFLTTGTAAERRQYVRDTLIGVFTSVLARMSAGDTDFDAIRTALVGVRYPAS